MKIVLDGGMLNTVYLPHIRNRHRYQIYFGGSASGKSVFLATRAVLDVLQGRNILVVRKVGRTIRGSCWNEILKAVTRMNLNGEFTVNKTDMTVTAKTNGCQILFAGLDDPEKVKSITPKKGPLTDIWMEEATEFERDDFKQLDKRMRGVTRWEKRMTLSFNPIYQQHWIYKAFFGIWEDGKRYIENGDVSILKTTYLDNRFLAEDDRRALEEEKNPYWREVYTLGNWGVVGNVIFTAWRTEDLTEASRAWPGKLYGLDFGFSSDPCGVVECALDRKRKTVYVFREICERGLTNTALAEELKRFLGSRPVTCDSAEPKSIQELKNAGIAAYAAKKGPDSVEHGIQWLQGHEIIIDKSCVHLREELTTYQWRTDKNGNAMRIPEDRNNHLIDALRYALESESTQRVATIGSKKEYGL